MTDTVPGMAGRLPAEIRLTAVDPEFRAGLPSWLRAPLAGCTPGAIREATIVLGELLDNAFGHAEPPYRVLVTGRSGGHLIRLAVTDSSSGTADEWRLGKGLLVVRGMCPQWGVLPAGAGGTAGKTVWALLPVLVPPSAARTRRSR